MSISIIKFTREKLNRPPHLDRLKNVCCEKNGKFVIILKTDGHCNRGIHKPNRPVGDMH